MAHKSLSYIKRNGSEVAAMTHFESSIVPEFCSSAVCIHVCKKKENRSLDWQ